MDIKVKDTIIPRQQVLVPRRNKRRLSISKDYGLSDISRIGNALTISHVNDKPPQIEHGSAFWISSDRLRDRGRMVPFVACGALALNPFGEGGVLFSGHIYKPRELDSPKKASFFHDEEVVSTLQQGGEETSLLPIARYCAAAYILQTILGERDAFEPVNTSVSQVCGKWVMPDVILLRQVWG